MSHVFSKPTVESTNILNPHVSGVPNLTAEKSQLPFAGAFAGLAWPKRVLSRGVLAKQPPVRRSHGVRRGFNGRARFRRHTRGNAEGTRHGLGSGEEVAGAPLPFAELSLDFREAFAAFRPHVHV